LRSNGRLYVAKVGELLVRWSRDVPSEPSSVTIIREPDDNYCASFVVDMPARPLPEVEREAGVDVGIARLATIVDTAGCASTCPTPSTYSQHGKVARARRDYHHKLALALVRDNQVIHVENLNGAGMVRTNG
jgi:putative transposase